MTGRILAVILAAGLSVPAPADAQTFKVDKYDIKGEGGTDYVAAEAATGRVFVSRSTHVMVVDGATGAVVGDIPNTPGVHGAARRRGHQPPEAAAADGALRAHRLLQRPRGQRPCRVQGTQRFTP